MSPAFNPLLTIAEALESERAEAAAASKWRSFEHASWALISVSAIVVATSVVKGVLSWRPAVFGTLAGASVVWAFAAQLEGRSRSAGVLSTISVALLAISAASVADASLLVVFLAASGWPIGVVGLAAAATKLLR